jgi:hypothetical protein
MKLISECQMRQLEAMHAASAVTCGGIGLAGHNWAIGRPLTVSIASGEKDGPLDRIENIRGRRQI